MTAVVASAVTYEDERQNLDPASVRPLVPDDVAQLADSQWLRNCARRRECIWQLIEPVCYRCIFHDVALVQNVGPCWRDSHIECIGVTRRKLSAQRHALEKVLHL